MTAPTAQRPAASPASRTATLALAGTEAKLLLTAPPIWVGAVICVALCTLWYGSDDRRWTAFSAEAGLSSLVLGGMLVMAGHLAGSRDHRHGATEGTRVLPSPTPRRTVALLALVPAAGVVGLVALGAELVAALTRLPGGPLDPWGFATAVMIPMLGAAAGIAVSRWLPATVAGPMTLFGCTAALAVLPVIGSSPDALAWRLFPVVLEDSGSAHGWHFAYLLSLLAAFVAVALLRHRRVASCLGLVLAAALLVVSVRQQVS